MKLCLHVICNNFTCDFVCVWGNLSFNYTLIVWAIYRTYVRCCIQMFSIRSENRNLDHHISFVCCPIVMEYFHKMINKNFLFIPWLISVKPDHCLAQAYIDTSRLLIQHDATQQCNGNRLNHRCTPALVHSNRLLLISNRVINQRSLLM